VGRKNLTLDGFIPAEMKETGKKMKEYLKDKDHTLVFLFPSPFSPGKKRRENPPLFRKHQHQHSL
jgi:hypothetical protein